MPDAGGVIADRRAHPVRGRIDSRGLVIRQRLLDALEPPAAAPLTIVTGPAGAGKTILISTWATARGAARTPVATLDTSARTVGGLWAKLAPALGVTALDDPPQTPDDLAERVLAIATTSPDDLTLVLDDLHLAEGATTRQALTRLAAEPDTIRLVLCSRIDPGLALHRMRLAGELSEIRSPDLAFTIIEAAELLEHQKIALSSGALRQLWKRTEGWAAGLRLAALSLAGHAEPEAFVADFAGDDRAVVAYLIDEVLERQPENARELLIATAVVDQISAPLANALTGRDDAVVVLDALVAANAFVIPLDRRGEWFRCHALLADLLRNQLSRRGPQAVERQHRTAARWFTAQDDPRSALPHAVRGGDWDRVTSILSDRWMELRAHDAGPLLDDALAAFPRPALAARPYAALVAAVRCLDHDEPDQAESFLQIALAARTRLSGARRVRFARDLALVRLQRATRDGDVAAGLRQLPVVSAVGDEEPARARQAGALAHLELGRLYAADGDDDARRHLGIAARLARESSDTELASAADGERAWLHMLDGELRGARLAADSADARIADDAAGSTAALLAHALISAEIGDLRRANEQLRCARTQIDDCPTEHGRLRALELELVDARIAVLGRRSETTAAYDRLRTALDGWDPPHRLADLAQAALADLLIALGRPAEALEQLPPVPDRRSGRAIGIARVAALLALRRSEEALVEGRLVAGAERLPLPSAVAASALAAGAAEAEGDRGEAQRHAEHALDLAEPEGVRLALAVVLDGLDPVLRRLLRVGTAHRSLIGEVLELASSGYSPSTEGVAPLHDPLSERELTVLRYLPTLLSSTEIAGELFVTVNTVKSHLKAIYRKLEVRNRREAVGRARALGLIAASGLGVARRAPARAVRAESPG